MWGCQEFKVMLALYTKQQTYRQRMDLLIWFLWLLYTLYGQEKTNQKQKYNADLRICFVNIVYWRNI